MKTIFNLLGLGFFFFFSIAMQAQSVKISGTVKDSAEAGMEMANVIALSATDNSMISYAITNSEGKYELSVPANDTIILRYSYLGFKTQDQQIVADENSSKITKNIVMKVDNNQLNEVEIVEEMPISISGDTIIYQADAFTNGEERKLEDILEKLPGFEVDDNGEITVQGKTVEKVMVEGRDFFDGDTKIATQNIPASAVDKVQVLRNYNDVTPMQGLDNDDRIALNIKLKDGKKNITFGDISAEGGVGDDKGRYLGHANVFFYTPKASFNVIGDANNLGKPAFTFRDYFRFTGGFKNLAQRSGSSLQIANDDLGFAIAQADRATEMTSSFGAANFSYNPNKKWSFSGFAIGNQSITDLKSNTFRTYVREEGQANQENLGTESTQFTNAGLFKLSSTYTPSNALHIGYDALFKITATEDDNTQRSDFGGFVNNITSLNEQLPVSLNQSFEAFYDLNKKSVITFEAQHLYKEQDPLYELTMTQRPFFQVLPLIDTNEYDLLQYKLITTNKIDANLNYYYIINNKNHINFTAGISNSNQSLNSEISQIANGSTLQEFTGDSLRNNVLFNLNDVFVGAHYKTKLGKLTMSPGVNFHRYSITDKQLGNENFNEKTLLLPDFFAKYDFKSTESLTFNYGMVAQFTDINNIILGTTITGYNSLFQGNRGLDNSWYHNFSMNYYSFNMFNFTNIFAGASYNVRAGDITNTIVYQGLDRINQPINTDAVNDVLSGFAGYQRRFGKFKAGLRGNVSLSNTNNTIDDQENTNTSLTNSYTVSLETNFKKSPNVEVGYRRTTNNYKSSQIENTFYTDNPFVEVQARFLESFIFEADYRYNFYKNKEGTTSSEYDFLNANLTYQKENSKWEFKIRALNLLNTTSIRQDAFSDNLISTSEYFVRPRYITLGVKYDL